MNLCCRYVSIAVPSLPRFLMLTFFVLLFSLPSELKAVVDTKMAWRSSGSNQRELIENLYRNGLIKDQRIKDAMLSVDRADFTDSQSYAYDDRPQSSKSNLALSDLLSFLSEF
jgi:hypothetical protein